MNNNIPAFRRTPVVPLVRLIIIVALSAMAIVAVGETKNQYQQGFGPEASLPEPKPPVSNAANYSQPFLTTALQFRELPYSIEKIRLEPKDYSRFDPHFYQVAKQKGWFPHKHNKQLQVVLPLDEVDQLQPMVEDPTGWVMLNSQPPVRPAAAGAISETPSTHLVNVAIEKRPVRHEGHFIVALLLIVVITVAPIRIAIEIYHQSLGLPSFWQPSWPGWD